MFFSIVDHSALRLLSFGADQRYLHPVDTDEVTRYDPLSPFPETTLRLLSLGADPNYLHPEKGTAPLHVAAKAGQILQIEVLVVYGSDPGGSDVNGDSVVDYARNAGAVLLWLLLLLLLLLVIYSSDPGGPRRQ